MASTPPKDPNVFERCAYPAPLAQGYRAFFIAASLYAMLMMALWLRVLHGGGDMTSLSPVIWHAHELLFGFLPAALAGFLLTSVRKWTGTAFPSEPVLAGFVTLWLAGRLAFLVPGLPVGWVAAVDLLFLPVLAASLAYPIVRARQLYNLAFPLTLLILAAINLLIHIETLGRPGADVSVGLHLATYVVVIVLVVTAGRLIPRVTDRGRGTRPRRWKTIEWLMPVATLGALVATLVAPTSQWAFAFGALAAATHAIRLAGWHAGSVWRDPVVWGLHAGYAWIVAGFALLAGVAAGVVAETRLALHAFGAGAIGGMTLAMMTRVVLRHAAPVPETAPLVALAFFALNVGVLVRVGVSLAFPEARAQSVMLSGLLWICAFGCFAAMCVRAFARPRADGGPKRPI